MILTLILDYNTLDDNYSLVNKKYERGLFLEVSLAQWAENFDFVQKKSTSKISKHPGFGMLVENLLNF